MRLAIASLLMSLAAASHAQSIVRLATIAPDGTTWARELKAWAHDVEKESGGAVHVKLYFGAIAGDEPEMAQRMARQQLDGMFGSMYCYQAAPSLRVSLIIGLFQDRDESSWLVNRLRPTLDNEFLEHGLVNLGESGLGSIIVFSRKPMASMSELRQSKLLLWGRDEYLYRQLPAIGIHPVLQKIEDGNRAYTEGRVDGFLAPASAALAFQWSAHARYFTDLRLGFVVGCGVMSQRSFDALPFAAQQAIRTASAKLTSRYELIARQQDDALLGGLFEKQGLTRVPVDERFRADFFAAARAARERLSDSVAPAELVRKVIGMLADYRAAHR